MKADKNCNRIVTKCAFFLVNWIRDRLRGRHAPRCVANRDEVEKMSRPARAIRSRRNHQCLADHRTDAAPRGKDIDATCPRELHVFGAVAITDVG